jgi:hypothetical protein
MIRARLALAVLVATLAGLGTAGSGWADVSGIPPIQNNNNQTQVCHAYPGAVAFNKNGPHGTPELVCGF